MPGVFRNKYFKPEQDVLNRIRLSFPINDLNVYFSRERHNKMAINVFAFKLLGPGCSPGNPARTRLNKDIPYKPYSEAQLKNVAGTRESRITGAEGRVNVTAQLNK